MMSWEILCNTNLLPPMFDKLETIEFEVNWHVIHYSNPFRSSFLKLTFTFISIRTFVYCVISRFWYHITQSHFCEFFIYSIFKSLCHSFLYFFFFCSEKYLKKSWIAKRLRSDTTLKITSTTLFIPFQTKYFYVLPW
jgi:hypothetical protein